MGKIIKKAPHLKEPWNNQPFSDLIILVGSQAWEAWNKGKGVLWQMLADGLQIAPFKQTNGSEIARYQQSPVILGLQQLEELAQLKIANEEQRYIKLIQCGELSEKHKTAICLNLATSTKADIVGLYNQTLDLLENLSGYINNLRNDDRSQENIAEIIAKAAIESDLNPKQNKNLPYIEKRYTGGTSGLYRITPKYDNSTGELLSEREEWLCDVVDVVGIGRSESEDFIILEWSLEGSNEKVIEPLPLENLGEREGWRQLKARGLSITTKNYLRNELADYWQNTNKGERRLWSVVSATGWQNGAYILPNGEIIGQPQNPVIFSGKSATIRGYTTRGTLDSWQSNIAKLVNKNSSMMLAIGVGFCSPLISLLEADSFGVHLFGDSSRGKTTTLKLVNSLYGHPQDTMLTWNTTEYAISNEAAAHNNGFLAIDEISQGEAKHAEKIAYTLFNGVGRNRGDKDEGNRELKRWSVTALSTGEEDLETMLAKKGIKINSGQLVRLLNIPFYSADSFHQFHNAKAHADYLNGAVLEHYGVVGREWIKWLSDTNNQAKCTVLYREMYNKWLARPPADADPQVFRVVGRFAIIETALHLSNFLTGWQPEDISEAVIHCFNEWVSIFGFHSKKELQIIEQVNGWLLANCESRFIEHPANPNQKAVKDIAGYRMLETDRNDKEHFFVYPLAFDEAISGHSKKQACEILLSKGMLQKGEKGYFMTKLPHKINSNRPRCFLLYPLDESHEEEQATQ